MLLTFYSNVSDDLHHRPQLIVKSYSPDVAYMIGAYPNPVGLQYVIPRAHACLPPKWQLDRFNSFCRVHRRLIRVTNAQTYTVKISVCIH